MTKGWIKLYRDSIDNPVFRKPLIWHYFEYCLLKAFHENQEIIWNGKKLLIERGSFITGRKTAAKETGLSEKNVRTALETLSLQGMVQKSATKSTSKFSYLTVCNYEYYQDKNNDGGHLTGQQGASKGPHIRMYKNKKKKYIDFVYLSEDEYKKLIQKFKKQKTDSMIEKLNGYIGQIGEKEANKKYKSHYHVILNWSRKDSNSSSRPTGVVL